MLTSGVSVGSRSGVKWHADLQLDDRRVGITREYEVECRKVSREQKRRRQQQLELVRFDGGICANRLAPPTRLPSIRASRAERAEKDERRSSIGA
jgi:hypothetical protein